MSQLLPCPSCSRHVRAPSRACPFCASALPSNLADGAIPAAPRRLDRLAAFTFAASLGLAACAGADTTPGDTATENDESELARRDAGARRPATKPKGGPVKDNGGIQPMYGAPPGDAGAPPVEDSGAIQPMYGSPPGDDDADSGAIQPMYGMPADR